MEEYKVVKYSFLYYEEWNNFVSEAKNATFLFYRDFMEYHSDRFEDYSLLIYNNQKLIAVFPANINENVVYSHQGLSYGGLILQKKTKLNEVIKISKIIFSFLFSERIQKVHLKLIPKIYHELPSDEIDYVLFLLKAKRTRVDISSVIETKSSLKIQANRIEGVKKAQRKGLCIQKSTNFEAFWNDILIPNISYQHSSKPTHTLEEISLLASHFPNNISLYNVYQGNTLVGGTIIFETKHVANVQYISGNNNKQALGTLDFLFQYMIKEKFCYKKYFSFGISNENLGMNVNEGLLYWKECFGARSISHEFYEIETVNHSFLDSVFI